MCLEPPLLPNELPEEDEWFCKECKAAHSVSSLLERRPTEALTHFVISVSEGETHTSERNVGGFTQTSCRF
jgi:hypothetical protein